MILKRAASQSTNNSSLFGKSFNFSKFLTTNFNRSISFKPSGIYDTFVVLGQDPTIFTFVTINIVTSDTMNVESFTTVYKNSFRHISTFCFILYLPLLFGHVGIFNVILNCLHFLIEILYFESVTLYNLRFLPDVIDNE